MGQPSAALKRVVNTALVALAAIVASAHVGSPNVVFDGMAGPYETRVIVRPPMVVPGLADVVVRAKSADVRRVIVRPVFLRVGAAGAPEGDVAKRVAGDSTAYAAQLWLMRSGAYSVYVTVEGARGSGTVTVPVMSVATGRLALSGPLAGILVALSVVLVAGLVTIVRAGAGESLVPPGDTPSPSTRRRANLAAVIALPVIAILVLGGARWWKSVDADYQRTMFRLPPLRAEVQMVGGSPMLMVFASDSSAPFTQLAPLIPDHGKLMHLFLISASDGRSFVHLHPVRDGSVFQVALTMLPPLPAGTYHAYADVTTELGSAVTLSGSVEVPKLAPTERVHANLVDPDAGWTYRAPVRVAPGAVVAVAPDLVVAWTGPAVPITTGHDTDLRFEVRDAKGAVVVLEPYLGMAGHAAIAANDGSVFIHLHPMGTISPIVQQLFALRDAGDTTSDGKLRLADTSAVATKTMAAMPAMRFNGALSFPYEFPKPGHYNIWVQIKRGGTVFTASFDTEVR